MYDVENVEFKFSLLRRHLKISFKIFSIGCTWYHYVSFWLYILFSFSVPVYRKIKTDVVLKIVGVVLDES